jgi:hypothetical protein
MTPEAREPGHGPVELRRRRPGFWAHSAVAPDYDCRAKMRKPAPSDPSQAALRSLIWRVIVFFVAGLVVIAAFVIAWRVGAFSPTRP